MEFAHICTTKTSAGQCKFQPRAWRGTVTVEWWGYVPDDSAGDRAVFSIGNDEVAKDWVNDAHIERWPFLRGARPEGRAIIGCRHILDHKW